MEKNTNCITCYKYICFYFLVSDRCFQGVNEDESGPHLKHIIEESGKFKNASFIMKCVPDELSEIEVKFQNHKNTKLQSLNIRFCSLLINVDIICWELSCHALVRI